MIEGLIIAIMLTSPVWGGHLVVRSCLNTTIIRRLRRSHRYEITTRIAVWDPTRGSGGRLIGRAHASYLLDESGVVQLRYTPRSGPERLLSGPLPPLATRPPCWPLLVVGGFVLAAMGGDALGYGLASGDDTTRSTVGMLGAMGGCAAFYLLSRLGLMGRHFRRRMPDKGIVQNR